MPNQQFGAPQPPQQHPFGPHSGPQLGQQAGVQPPQWAAAPPGTGQSLHPQNAGSVAQPASRIPGVNSAPGLAPLRLPVPERGYRIGGVVAWVLFAIGLVLMSASLVLLVLHAAGIKVPGTLGTMLGFTGGLPGAIGIFAVGVMQVFAAQMGRALFDTANATRDLAMIERAKIAHAAGDAPFPDDDSEPA
jgi:hypothetical protein